MESRGDILLLEDDALVRASLARALRRVGFFVTEAGTLAAARSAIDLGPDLLLTDIDLPDGSGIDLVRASLQAGVEIQVIVISGVATPEQIHQLHEVGVTEFQQKPITLARLLRAIDRLMPTALARET